jgi:hypothetical protein
LLNNELPICPGAVVYVVVTSPPTELRVVRLNPDGVYGGSFKKLRIKRIRLSKSNMYKVSIHSG